MKRSSVGHFNCSIARSLDVVGEWWTLLVCATSSWACGASRPSRPTSASPATSLSDRLTTLVEHGVLAKRRYQDHPDRYEYVLTEMGRDLAPVLAALMRWGDRWLSPDGPPMVTLHRECGQPSSGAGRARTAGWTSGAETCASSRVPGGASL